MSPPPAKHLNHILDEIRFVLNYSSTVEKDEFLQDPILKRAVVRSLEVIGEAAKQIPQEYQEEHPDIEWSGMAGMRDRLIHGYFGIDYELVWDVIKNKLPGLGRKINSLIQNTA